MNMDEFIMPIGLDKGMKFKDIPLGRIDAFLSWLETRRAYPDLQRKLVQYLKDNQYKVGDNS